MSAVGCDGFQANRGHKFGLKDAFVSVENVSGAVSRIPSTTLDLSYDPS